MTEKFILDAACGGRMFWFDKNHPNTLYIDNRIAKKGHLSVRPNHEVRPDIVMDFRAMNLPDNSFKLVVWDPPHLKRLKNSSIMRKRFGVLGPEWKDDLLKGFNECWRVLEDYGSLVFKWNESEIKTSEVLSLFPIRPLFGHPTGSKSRTKWMYFMKIPKKD